MNAAATTLLALVALVPAAAFAHGGPPGHGHHDGRPVATCPANVVAAFDDLDNALRHMAVDVENLRQKDRRALRDDVAAALERSQRARRVACRETRDDRPDVIVVQPTPPPQPVIIVLDEPRQRELVTVVRREAFDDGRLGVLELGLRDVCVTSAQAKELVRELTFSNGRLDAVRIVAPRIVDRDRSHVVLESLTFDSDRRDAREILTRATPAAHCTVRRI